MTGEAAGEAFLGCLAGFVPAVDQASQITDISAGEIAYIADVEGDSAFSLQGFEVAVFELFQEGRTIRQHGVQHSGFKWKRKQENGEEAEGQPVVLTL
jgi:hypothetical protein